MINMTKTAELKERIEKQFGIPESAVGKQVQKEFFSFLLQELQTQRESDLREVENLKEKCDECENKEIHDTPRNIVLDEVIEVIRALTPLGME